MRVAASTDDELATRAYIYIEMRSSASRPAIPTSLTGKLSARLPRM
jgi:hypothetical protein